MRTGMAVWAGINSPERRTNLVLELEGETHGRINQQVIYTIEEYYL